MRKKILLITKDALCRKYLPVYGNQHWKGKTPNIDELAEKGTVFTNYYTAAPSTAMAYLGMFLQKYTYELDVHDYSPIKEEFKDNVFRKLEDSGYKTHIIWERSWDTMTRMYANCFGNAIFHNLDDFQQAVGPHFRHEGDLVRDETKEKYAIELLSAEVDQIIAENEKEKLFLWIHLPHVMNGRTGYGDDIDLFDHIVGICRRHFDDNSIYISADHGNLNGTHGHLGYGFDVYDSSIRIPLITPMIENNQVYEDPVSAIDLFDIILDGKVKRREFVFSDTAYYKQPKRKLAIIKGSFKYIYNKIDNSEEAYDLNYDDYEQLNLISPLYYDKERHIEYPLKEMIDYDNWDQLGEFIKLARQEKNRIWRSETRLEKLYWTSRYYAGRTLRLLSSIKKHH